MGVFDGHGVFGHDISDFIAKCVMNKLINLIDNNNDISTSLKLSFIQSHE